VFLSSVVDRDIETRFFDLIIARLYFLDHPDRYESIQEARDDTFHWMFENDPQQLVPDGWDTLTEWLSGSNNDNVFWISGKPGSGKKYVDKTPLQ
jgi:hypothetical protein